MVVYLFFKCAIKKGVNYIHLKGLKVEYSDNRDKRTKGLRSKSADSYILVVRDLKVSTGDKTGLESYDIARFVYLIVVDLA